MSIIKPVTFKAMDSKGNVYKALVETFINSCQGFGYVESDIPEKPSNMRELIDLRQKGYIIQDVKDGCHAC
jgi:hypothetical protein